MTRWDDRAAVPLFHTVEGAGQRTLLLVHGEACDSHDWAPQIDAFAARHRLIIPDLPGHGRSSPAPHGHTPRDFADDLAGLLVTTGEGPVVAVGHSAGAVIASVLAVERPDLVEAVIAVSPRYGMDAGRAAARAAAVGVPRPAEAIARLLAEDEGPPTGPAADWLPAWRRRRALGTADDVVTRTAAGLYDAQNGPVVRPACEPYLRRRTCPVLTVCSRASLEARGVGPGWDRSVSPHPYSACVVHDGAGHWPHQRRPEEFNDLVLDWTAGLPTPGTGRQGRLSAGQFPVIGRN
ncbi:alpha/beta fold hydrolase [Streptomyces panaciradicis]|uniref:alpha/beta fold hydrolase n=1 Tax=Streptomyces panaciradicis TaxID=1470261 RepID=UPI00201CF2A3|nr:alpha/beta hydrolase [Streptomyces panaciradicis]MCL6674448.1 alpha/beta hydrolase [Streptomyces panaciradicis]